MRWTRSPICGKRQEGKFILVRQINTKRMRDKLREIKETLYRMCHQPMPEQGRWLGQVLRCYFAYHAVPTTSRRMTAFAFHVVRYWRRALMRRSQKAFVPWQRIKLLVARWIPSARVRHPWPQFRFLVKHPRWEPSVVGAQGRICPAGAG
jgi:RNA-directed DNA polymerase